MSALSTFSSDTHIFCARCARATMSLATACRKQAPEAGVATYLISGAGGLTVQTVAVLFARADSARQRRCRTGTAYGISSATRCAGLGGAPVVAHPPRRAWGKPFYFAKPGVRRKGI